VSKPVALLDARFADGELHSFTKTDMGNAGAKFFGLPEVWIKINDSVARILKRVRGCAKLLGDEKSALTC
jgi:hypothetical protein